LALGAHAGSTRARNEPCIAVHFGDGGLEPPAAEDVFADLFALAEMPLAPFGGSFLLKKFSIVVRRANRDRVWKRLA
jgi:hypothetical protein